MTLVLIVVVLLVAVVLLLAASLILWRVVAQRVPDVVAPAVTSSPKAPTVAAPSPGDALAPKSAKTTKASDASALEVTPPDRLQTFADVGGMGQVKEELRTAIRLLIDHSGLADQYDIDWNGVLLHGAPGVGKTLLARACAGEMRLGFIYVSTADIVSKWIGAGPGKVDEAFRFAQRNTPCILFFDEFDSLAAARADEHHVEYRRLTNQLLASLEEYRNVEGLIVMAATNAYAELDPTVIRPGRFDRHIEIPMPDVEARAAIISIHLRDRPTADDVDIDELALVTEGRSTAALESMCDAAALECAAEATAQSRLVLITQPRLIAHVA